MNQSLLVPLPVLFTSAVSREQPTLLAVSLPARHVQQRVYLAPKAGLPWLVAETEVVGFYSVRDDSQRNELWPSLGSR